MFPVTDRRGRVVAFGGRILDGDGPKYINSPDGPLFHKGRLLYGLSRARMAAGQGHTAIVAEGYMDVITLVRAGFQAAMAPLGTALTEAQILELWKIAPVPVLCFDGDDAGRRAAWRAVERVLPLLRPDHSVRVAYLPPGEDPDTLIAGGGAAAMRSALDGALSLADVVWERAVAAHRTDSPEGRAGLKTALEAQARGIADPTVRDFYLRDLRDRVAEAFPWRPARRRGAVRPEPVAAPRPRRPAAGGDGRLVTAILLAAVVNHPVLFDEVGETVGLIDVADPTIAALQQEIIGVLSARPGLDSAALRRHLCEAGHGDSLARLLNDRIYGSAPFARPAATIEEARDGWRRVWRGLDERRARRELRAAGRRLGEAPTAANLARVTALQAEWDGGEGDDPG